MSGTPESWPTIADVEEADRGMAGVLKSTPLVESRCFSEMAKCRLLLKLECMQTTGSFKARGAFNCIAHIPEAERGRPVVAASAGNHAQGVAYAATRLGMKSTIFMPTFAPPLKVAATRGYGADIVLAGDAFDDAYAASQRFCAETGATYVHPFNDRYVIAGQGTVGLDIYRQCPSVDVVLAPIGGGGLITGLAIALKARNPNIYVVGVQAEGAPSMAASRAAGKVVTLPKVGTIADGIAVKTPGDLTFALCEKYVDEVVTVSEEEIAHTAYLLLQRTKVLAEPASATSLAAVLYKKTKLDLTGKTVVPVISGGNINMALLEQIIQQGMMRDRLREQVDVVILDKSSVLSDIIAFFAKNNIQIHSLSHDRASSRVPVNHTLVSFIVDLQNTAQTKDIAEYLTSQGITFVQSTIPDM